jgi:hypothetical protein
MIKFKMHLQKTKMNINDVYMKHTSTTMSLAVTTLTLVLVASI